MSSNGPTPNAAETAPDNGIKITVVIPTFNREPLLKEAIESLFEQSLEPSDFEVLIIDNCSTDDTAGMIEEVRARAPFKIIYRRMEENGGCFRSLNIGTEMSRTEFVGLLDSDARACRDWVKNGLEGLASGDDIAFVSGYIADKPEQPVRFFCTRNGAPKTENPYYPSGNIFFRRSKFLEMGGYDENLSFGDMGTSPVGCADSDLCWRMKEKGYGYLYRDDVVIYHEVANVGPLVWLKFHWRMISVPFLMKRHPELRKQLRWNLFFQVDNIFFYLALVGLVGAVLVSPWALALCLFFVFRAGRVRGRGLSPLQLVKAPARIAMLGIRQAVMCTALALGSLRARTVVL